jgi:hypothetical protein
MADEKELSDIRLLNGIVNKSCSGGMDLLICLAQACSLRPATALHQTASILIAERSEPANSSNAVLL